MNKELWMMIGFGIFIGIMISIMIFLDSKGEYYYLDEYSCTELELALIQGNCVPRSEGWLFTGCYSHQQIKDSREIRCK